MRASKNMGLNTRENKIAMLKSIEEGKTTAQDLIQPVWGVIYVKDGKVYRHSTSNGDKDINPPVDEATYKQQNVGRYTHIIQIVDFSEKSK